jgi:hypothetical protein
MKKRRDAVKRAGRETIGDVRRGGRTTTRRRSLLTWELRMETGCMLQAVGHDEMLAVEGGSFLLDFAKAFLGMSAPENPSGSTTTMTQSGSGNIQINCGCPK